MMFRHPRPERGKLQQKQEVEQALRTLPRPKPRKGLQQEMWQAILAEVHRETEAVPRQNRHVPLRTLRTSLSVAGLIAAVALAFVLLPNVPRTGIAIDSPTDLEGSAAVSTGNNLNQEIAEQKALHEQRLLHQVIPQDNGQYIGEGAEITIYDRDSVLANKGVLGADLESDIDLYRLIQEIYQNGGQLVAINEIPVEKYTEIVTTGTLTRVRDRRIQSPYTIKVIGDRDLLTEKLLDSNSFLMQLKKEGNMDVQVTPLNWVTIDGAP